MSADAVLHARGKVRDVYEVGDRLLIVATDRISAFDAVLPTPIPDKGRVLTGLSLFWFDRTADLVGNHLVSAEPRDLPSGFDDDLPGRAMLVKRAEVVPRRMRRARLPLRLRVEAVRGGRTRLRRGAPARPGGVRPPARADLHPHDEGRRRARPAAHAWTRRATWWASGSPSG